MEEENKSKKEIEKEERQKELQDLNEAADRVRKEKEELKNLIELREKQRQEERVSGDAEAGQTPPPVDKEKEEIDYINNVLLKDTGLSI